MRRAGYVLWALTLVVVAWAIAAVSAFMAGKGKIWMKAEVGIWEEGKVE